MARTQVQAELIATNAISGTIIADNAITATHIATNSISGVLVQDSGIVTTMIAANNVTAAKIVSDGIETRHLHSNVISGLSTVTAASGDFVLIGDTSDSNNLKKALASDFGETDRLPLAGGTMTGPLGITSNTPVITFIESDQSNKQYQLGSFGSAFAIYDANNTEFRYVLDTSGNHVFNEGGTDSDFRVESNNNANMLFVDGGNDKVGIGTASPSHMLHVNAADGASDNTQAMTIENNEATDGRSYGLKIKAGSTVNDASLFVQDHDASNDHFIIRGNGAVGIGTTAPSVPLHITESGSDSYEDVLKIERSHASSTAAGLVFHLTGTGGTAQATAIFVEQQEDWTSGTSRSSNLQMQCKTDGTDRNYIQVGSFGDGTSEIRLSTMDSIRIKADTAGHVTMPATAAFLARPSGGQNNLAVNVDHTISFGTEVFDQNADFGSHTFTAPVTGKYQLNASVQFYDSDSATAYHHVKIITSNRAYQNIASLNKMSADPAYWTFNISVLADMDANDTAYVMVAIPNTGTAQADITTESYFSGFLAC